MALVSSCLILRLVFEVNLWGYYFMALAVLLLILDVLRRRIRLSYVAWLVIVTYATLDGGLATTHSFVTLPTWLWQLILVPSALWLALAPLYADLRQNRPAGEPMQPIRPDVVGYGASHDEIDDV